MAKIQYTLVIIALALFAAVCQAEPQLTRSGRLTRPRPRYLARQETEEAVTPYPSADELKPEIPFEEAAAAPADEPTPDEVYGPPEPSYNNVPDEIYGPPEVSDNGLPAVEDPAAETFPAPLDEQQARLVAARRAAKLRQRKAVAYRKAVAARSVRPAKLRAAPRRFA